MDFRKNLLHYMLSFPGGVVVFFDTVSCILKDLGDDWIAYGKAENNSDALTWGKVFTNAALSIDAITLSIAKIKDDYDVKQNIDDPLSMIKEFRDQINR